MPRTLLLTLLVLALAPIALATNDDVRPLAGNAPVERELVHPAVHQYTVELREGEFLRAVVDQRGIDLVVTLYGPDGTRIIEIDSPNGSSGPEPIELLAPSTGSYRIEVRAFAGQSPGGKYAARIDSIQTAEEYAAAVAAEKAAQRATSRWFAETAIRLRTPEAGNGFADMQPLKRLIGNARVVALGEATHGTREFFQLKHRMLEFLVTKMGFTVFAIEATMPEAFAVNEYVLTGKGDARKALGGLYFWTWDTEEVLEMIEWMRRYNADPSHRKKVKFYGFDMQSPAMAVEVMLDYLRTVDPEHAAIAESELDSLANPFTEQLFQTRSKEHQQKVAAALAAVAKRFDEQKADYIRKSSASRYALARQHVRIVEQNLESRTGTENTRFVVRDRSMAENIRWILEREGPGTKLVAWAHNGHVATQEPVMGSWLRKALGSDMVVIGFSFNQGSFQAMEFDGTRIRNLRSFSVPAAPPKTLDSTLAASGVALGIVDLRTLKKGEPVTKWLNAPRETLSLGSMFDVSSAIPFFSKVNVMEIYDAIAFFDKTTAARANPGGMRTTSILSQPENLDFENGGNGEAPPGWRFPPQLATFDFTAATSGENPRLGTKCATIRREKGKHYGVSSGALTQNLDASAYRGKRVRLRASVRTAVEGRGNQGHLFLSASEQTFAQPVVAEASDRPITAGDWQDVERIVDVGKNAQSITFGLALVGEGQVWIDAVSIQSIEE